MIFALAFFSGACAVIGTLLVAGMFEPATVVPEWRPLSNTTQTLLNWGRRHSEFRLYRPRPLPRRLPGAAVRDVPDPQPLHTNEVADYVSPSRWIPRRLWLWWICKLNKISILESDEAFAKWWEDTWSSERRYQHHGRHRLDERDEVMWREQHAKIPTAEWPTLATSGYAGEIIAQDVRPVICIGPRLPNGLSSLLRIECSSYSSTFSSDFLSSELAYVT